MRNAVAKGIANCILVRQVAIRRNLRQANDALAQVLSRLPKSGDVWPETDRKLWLQLLEGSFKLIYKEKAVTGSAETKEAAN